MSQQRTLRTAQLSALFVRRMKGAAVNIICDYTGTCEDHPWSQDCSVIQKHKPNKNRFNISLLQTLSYFPTQLTPIFRHLSQRVLNFRMPSSQTSAASTFKRSSMESCAFSSLLKRLSPKNSFNAGNGWKSLGAKWICCCWSAQVLRVNSLYFPDNLHMLMTAVRELQFFIHVYVWWLSDSLWYLLKGILLAGNKKYGTRNTVG